MKAEWIIDEKVLEKIREVIRSNENKPRVRERREDNIEKKDINLSKDNIWKAFVGCEITSQQKSGENSLVELFLGSNNDVLIYDKCKSLKQEEISEQLSKNRLRFNRRIPNLLIKIINNLY